jgi:predicted lipoprotein with Yx(FWY)xxD motif
MSAASHPHKLQGSRRSGRSALTLAVVVVAVGFAGALAAIAIASGTSPSVGSASNPTLGAQVLVDSRGHTLYELSPETAARLLCKGQCLSFWPPLTARSSKAKLHAAAGVHGRLGTLHRRGGTVQITLNGHPLYRYSGDHAAGQANGEGIKSFGGTWHTVVAGSSTAPPSTSTPVAPPAPAPPAYPTTPTETTPIATSTTPTTTTPPTTTTTPPYKSPYEY